MKEPEVNVSLAVELGLTEDEYSRILAILGRVPTYTELGIYSVMWSEHCSYKNSIEVLKTLPRTGGRLLIAAGEENAGLVDIGEGLAIAFKIESHNHPSAVEPYQGAATGVGGILRDIFAMGARPIAILNSLRFGNPEHPKVQYSIKGIVKGIGDYGNSFGVPTVAGEVYFEDCYEENPLVNAMAVGVVEVDRVAKAVARGEGNSVMIVGSSTGRDGIHGATFASEEISDDSAKKRPSVQVGDPFTEKLLLEATLEALASDCLIGVQDMGAAGITCSTSEMSAKGGCGMIIDLDRVPVREEGMNAYELMLSESQERMLLVVRKGFEERVKQIYAKWDLGAETIGEITGTGKLIVLKGERKVAEVPAESLVLGGGAPVYRRDWKIPAYISDLRAFDENSVGEPEDPEECFLKVLSSVNIGSKHWVYEQYDSMVRANTIVQDSGDAAVIRLKGTEKLISLKTDCNARYAYLNPRRGGSIAVAEAARNVVCTGAKPIAITNCLNFGNPYKPEVFWQFKEVVAGIGDACRVLETPVTGGNVSFYNDNPVGAVYPTPVIGMLGLIESMENVTTLSFKEEGDLIVLLGSLGNHIGGSEYLKVWHHVVAGDAPPIDLALEKNVQTACLEMIREGYVKSAHDTSEGGLAVSLAESCMAGGNGIGAWIELNPKQRADVALFGEDQSRIIVTTDPRNVDHLYRIAKEHKIQAKVIGEVGGDELRIGSSVKLGVGLLKSTYEGTLKTSLEEKGGKR